MVDAKHVERHLDEEKEGGAINEAIEQGAFADRLLLNKVDLVPDEVDLLHVEANLSHVMDIRAFELERALDLDPDFLQHGATAHAHAHAHGHGHGHGQEPGHACSEACTHGEEEAGAPDAHGHGHGHGHGQGPARSPA